MMHMVMVVVVVVVVVVAVLVGVDVPAPRGLEARGRERGPDAEHQEPRCGAEPGEELLRHYVVRGGERHEAEGVHAEGVCCGNDETQEERVACRPACPDAVGADDRLTVPGAEG